LEEMMSRGICCHCHSCGGFNHVRSRLFAFPLPFILDRHGDSSQKGFTLFDMGQQQSS
jgi:hypothetical protein